MADAACGGFEADPDALSGLAAAWAAGSAEVQAVARAVTAVLEKATGPDCAGGGQLAAQLELREVVVSLAEAEQAAVALAVALRQDAQGVTQCADNYRRAENCVKQHIAAAKPSPRDSPSHSPVPSPDPTTTAGGAPGVIDRAAGTTQVQIWIRQAFADLEASGVPSWQLDLPGVLTIIEHESSGNPGAVNDWDSNWQAGHASKGLMQCIDGTFDEFKLPGHDDIFNPVDNIIAGVRYAISRYGSISNVPGVRAVADGGQYVGY
jgi:hypothetical protein